MRSSFLQQSTKSFGETQICISPHTSASCRQLNELHEDDAHYKSNLAKVASKTVTMFFIQYNRRNISLFPLGTIIGIRNLVQCGSNLKDVHFKQAAELFGHFFHDGRTHHATGSSIAMEQQNAIKIMSF